MKALHYGEGNYHQQRPLTLAVLTNTMKVVEQSPSEMVHIRVTITFEH